MYTAEQAAGSADISALFEKYRQTGDKNVRNELIMRSMHIVRYAVISTRNMFRKYADDDDISGEAVMALMNAVDSFNPAKNVKFDTYASIKVRGAIIDYIRKMDIIPRGVRKFAKEYDSAFAHLCSELDREPTREELAKYMGISTEKLDSFAAKSAAAQTLSFEELAFSGFDPADETEGEFYEAEQRIMMEERKAQLAEAIKKLKDKERTVITLYYYEKLKYSEIAQVLGLSESRVCQIHAKAVEKMKDSLSEYMLQ